MIKDPRFESHRLPMEKEKRKKKEFSPLGTLPTTGERKRKKKSSPFAGPSKIVNWETGLDKTTDCADSIKVQLRYKWDFGCPHHSWKVIVCLCKCVGLISINHPLFRDWDNLGCKGRIIKLYGDQDGVHDIQPSRLIIGCEENSKLLLPGSNKLVQYRSHCVELLLSNHFLVLGRWTYLVYSLAHNWEATSVLMSFIQEEVVLCSRLPCCKTLPSPDFYNLPCCKTLPSPDFCSLPCCKTFAVFHIFAICCTTL